MVILKLLVVFYIQSVTDQNMSYASFSGFCDGSASEEYACNDGDTEDLGSVAGSGGSLENEMATHSSILAWEIPWTGEPGGLPSMGSHRVDLAAAAAPLLEFSSHHPVGKRK